MEYYIHLQKSPKAELWHLCSDADRKTFASKKELMQYVDDQQIKLAPPKQDIDWGKMTQEEKVALLLGIA